jgi:uncharacterized protein DUF3311
VKKPLFWTLVVSALYALHQDFWFWRSARPLFAGFLPIALTYHALYCVAASALMWALTAYAWPSHLEDFTQTGAVRDKGRRR